MRNKKEILRLIGVILLVISVAAVFMGQDCEQGGEGCAAGGVGGVGDTEIVATCSVTCRDEYGYWTDSCRCRCFVDEETGERVGCVITDPNCCKRGFAKPKRS